MCEEKEVKFSRFLPLAVSRNEIHAWPPFI